MSHYQKDADTEKGYVIMQPSAGDCLTHPSRYSLRDGATFTEQARDVTFDLAVDDATQARLKSREMHWDKKKKKFIKGMGEGADNTKMVRTESGAKLPATFRSGRFDEWKAKNRISVPKVGEAEDEGATRRSNSGGRKWKHNQVATPKPLDKLRTDYERKTRQRKMGEQSTSAEDIASSPRPPPTRGKKGGALGKRFKGKTVGKVRSELKTIDQIRKTRQIAEKKRAKNARPNRKGKR